MPEIVARYTYRDGDRQLLFEVVRSYPKSFVVLDNSGQQIADFPAPLVLYRLPELLEAPPWQTVYVTEGEKDTDRLCHLGLTATTNPGGCRLGWQPHYSRWLEGRHVVILADNDKPGQRHAAAVRQALRGQAASAVVVALPQLPRAGDVSDWLDRGKTPAALQQQVDKARLAAAGLTGRPNQRQQDELILGSGLPTLHKFLLLVLQRHLDRRGLAAPTMGELARQMSAHRVTIQNAMRDLRRQAVVRNEEGGMRIDWPVLAAMNESLAVSAPAGNAC